MTIRDRGAIGQKKKLPQAESQVRFLPRFPRVNIRKRRQDEWARFLGGYGVTHEAIMKFGESLRKERELRGITLEKISQHTKVHIRFLEAIENDDLSVLPAKAFAKGFLRSYARMVDLDEDLVMTNFEYCHQALQTDQREQVSQGSSAATSRRRPLFYTIFFIILVLLAVIIVMYQGYLRIN